MRKRITYIVIYSVIEVICDEPKVINFADEKEARRYFLNAIEEHLDGAYREDIRNALESAKLRNEYGDHRYHLYFSRNLVRGKP